jgi:hypothetical protein
MTTICLILLQASANIATLIMLFIQTKSVTYKAATTVTTDNHSTIKYPDTDRRTPFWMQVVGTVSAIGSITVLNLYGAFNSDLPVTTRDAVFIATMVLCFLMSVKLVTRGH